MADDPSQVAVPAPFIALYVPVGRVRPELGRAELQARWEFCEDLAQVLVDQVRRLCGELGITREDVMARIESGLLDPASGVRPAEVPWVSGRIAELHGEQPNGR